MNKECCEKCRYGNMGRCKALTWKCDCHQPDKAKECEEKHCHACNGETSFGPLGHNGYCKIKVEGATLCSKCWNWHCKGCKPDKAKGWAYKIMHADTEADAESMLKLAIEEAVKEAMSCPPHDFVYTQYIKAWASNVQPPTQCCTKCGAWIF